MYCPGRAVCLHLRIEDNSYSTVPIGGIPDDQVAPAKSTVVRCSYKEILEAFLQTVFVKMGFKLNSNQPETATLSALKGVTE